MLSLNIKENGNEVFGKLKNQLTRLNDLLFPKGREIELSGKIRDILGGVKGKLGGKPFLKL